MGKIKVEGLDELRKKLAELPTTIEKKILREELRGATKEIASEVKPLVPVGETGFLSRSIKVRSAKRKKGRIAFLAQIGEGAFKGESFYGSFVELGTTDQPAQHFMERGAEKVLPRLANDFPERIAKRIEDEGAK
jgi:HK97 gp10 family phage protein